AGGGARSTEYAVQSTQSKPGASVGRGNPHAPPHSLLVLYTPQYSVRKVPFRPSAAASVLHTLYWVLSTQYCQASPPSRGRTKRKPFQVPHGLPATNFL